MEIISRDAIRYIITIAVREMDPFDHVLRAKFRLICKFVKYHVDNRLQHVHAQVGMNPYSLCKMDTMPLYGALWRRMQDHIFSPRPYKGEFAVSRGSGGTTFFICATAWMLERTTMPIVITVHSCTRTKLAFTKGLELLVDRVHMKRHIALGSQVDSTSVLLEGVTAAVRNQMDEWRRVLDTMAALNTASLCLVECGINSNGQFPRLSRIIAQKGGTMIRIMSPY
jgi:hypothetical protein